MESKKSLNPCIIQLLEINLAFDLLNKYVMIYARYSSDFLQKHKRNT